MRAPAASVGLILAWAVAGALLALGVVAILSIGPFALAAAAVLIGLLARRAGLGTATAGLPCGAAAIPFYVAYLNRGGPGQVCTTPGSGNALTSACVSELSPWPGRKRENRMGCGCQ